MSRKKRPSMITDSNQECFVKMTGRRLQEELFYLPKFFRKVERESKAEQRMDALCATLHAVFSFQFCTPQSVFRNWIRQLFMGGN
jgi:hypothetical protein